MDEVQSTKNSTFDIPLSDTKYCMIFESLVFYKYLFYKIIPANIVHAYCTFQRKTELRQGMWALNPISG